MEILGDTDIELLIKMAADKSVTVRQRVVQILSRCLDTTESTETSTNVMLILSRQNDFNLRLKVVNCLA